MSFVPNYKYDIFFSYAHLDNDEIPNQGRWVTKFKTSFEGVLNQELGRRASLCFDAKDFGVTKTLPQEVKDKIASSAVLLAITSPGYLGSEWCAQERSHILEAQRPWPVRVVVVEYLRVDRPAVPRELAELRGHPFWIEEPDRKPYPLWPQHADYFPRLYNLCHQVAEVLRQIQIEEQARGTNVRQTAPAVFLAYSTYDLARERKEVADSLDQVALRVLPDTDYHSDGEGFGERAERDMKACSLFVQLLSAFALPDGRGNNLAQVQADIARRLGKTILQWRHTELPFEQVSSENQKQLLQGPDVRAEPIEDFKRAVKKRALEKPPSPAEPPERIAQKATSGLPFIFVNADVTDRSLGDEVCMSLDRLNPSYVRPIALDEEPAGLTPAKLREDLEENLRHCDGLIIIYGKSDVVWVRNQLRQSWRIRSTRDRELEALAVFEGPPEPKLPLGIQLPRMAVLDCRKGFNEAHLKQFVEGLMARLKAGVGG
jgi:hypothetical protein